MQKAGRIFAEFFVLVLVAVFLIIQPFFALASETNGTIDVTSKYGWSDQAGWINFGTAYGNIQITDSGITGYAWNENYGWINMDPVTSGISVSSSGDLSGYAWGENLGWINFSGTSISCSGQFSGTATGTAAGTITFDCTNCAVETDYRPSTCRTDCGDGICDSPSETCSNCTADCGTCGGGGGYTYNKCDAITHQCVQVDGYEPDECPVLGGPCCDPHGDLNWDGYINLTDFSILMYYWEQTPPSNPCPDINKDGTVDLLDFSIMLYWWTE